jgi:HEAT repeat protein
MLEPKRPEDLVNATVEELSYFLSAEDARLRADAACALGDRLRDKSIALPEETKAKLLAQLDDENMYARLEAAIALSEIKDTRATLILLALCAKSATRLDALHALGILGDIKAREPLRSLMNGLFMPWADKMQAAAALCRLNDQTGADYLVARMKAWRKAEKAAAIHFIGESAHPRAFEILAAIFGDERHPMRDVAIRALGHLGDERALPLFERFYSQLPAIMQHDIELSREQIRVGRK